MRECSDSRSQQWLLRNMTLGAWSQRRPTASYRISSYSLPSPSSPPILLAEASGAEALSKFQLTEQSHRAGFLDAAGLHMPLQNLWLFKRSSSEPINVKICAVTSTNLLKKCSRETSMNPMSKRLGWRVFSVSHTTTEKWPSIKCLITLNSIGNHPDRHLLGWMYWFWSFLATHGRHFLFSRVESDLVKNHTERQSCQALSFVFFSGKKMGSGVWKSNKTEQRLHSEIEIKSDEAATKDTNNVKKDWCTGVTLISTGGTVLQWEDKWLGLTLGSCKGVADGGSKTWPSETAGDWELVPSCYPWALLYTHILSKAQTRASSLDPLRTEDKTGLIPSSGSRCSCFDSNDRCLFIFLIILWLNNFISVVIKNVLMAHSYVGSIAGPGAVPGHVGVGKGPICTDDISYMYCWCFLCCLQQNALPKTHLLCDGLGWVLAILCNFLLSKGFKRPKSQASSCEVTSAQVSSEMASHYFTQNSSKALFMH